MQKRGRVYISNLLLFHCKYCTTINLTLIELQRFEQKKFGQIAAHQYIFS